MPVKSKMVDDDLSNTNYNGHKPIVPMQELSSPLSMTTLTASIILPFPPAVMLHGLGWETMARDVVKTGIPQQRTLNRTPISRDVPGLMRIIPTVSAS